MLSLCYGDRIFPTLGLVHNRAAAQLAEDLMMPGVGAMGAPFMQLYDTIQKKHLT
jgi:imidazoleglycerol phosphate synthase glutamine amidotransferase subunit HisH